MPHRRRHARRFFRPLGPLGLTIGAIAILLALDAVVTEFSLSASHAHEKPATSAPDGSDADLLARSRKIFSAIPAKPSAEKGSPSPEVVELGRKLFFDPRISADGVRSCMLCHQPALYGTDALPRAKGVDNKLLPRNAPTVLNSGLQFRIHWDGVFDSVEAQAKAALLGPAFANAANEEAIERIRAIPGYRDLFAAAFPDESDPITVDHWGHAIGAYERTLNTPGRFDDFLNGQSGALTKQERRGLKLFLGAGCADCHGGAGLGGNSFEKFGVVSDYWKETKSAEIDKGRFGRTNKDEDLYVFKVAPLRNIAMTPPYFHDGSVATLPEAVRVMAKVQLDATFQDSELADVVAFLESLTAPLPDHFANAPLLPPGQGVRPGVRSP